MNQRLWRYRFQKALLVAAILRFVPFVRMIGLNGSMVTGLMTDQSDIDFYIVLKKGRIFSGRVLVTLIVQLLGVRRHGLIVAGRICLNRFSHDQFLTITEENYYHARVFHNLIPLFSRGNCYERYCQANTWMTEWDLPVNKHQVVLKDTPLSWLIRTTLEAVFAIVGGSVENVLRKRQYQRYAQDVRVKQVGSQVVISDRELRFQLAKE